MEEDKVWGVTLSSKIVLEFGVHEVKVGVQ